MGNRVILTCIMSTIPHKHVHCINFEKKLSHLKNHELSKPQIYEVSKGVSEILPKFPHEVIFRTRKFGNSFISLPFSS
jgi:hypothetical protein